MTRTTARSDGPARGASIFRDFPDFLATLPERGGWPSPPGGALRGRRLRAPARRRSDDLDVRVDLRVLAPAADDKERQHQGYPKRDGVGRQLPGPSGHHSKILQPPGPNVSRPV